MGGFVVSFSEENKLPCTPYGPGEECLSRILDSPNVRILDWVSEKSKFLIHIKYLVSLPILSCVSIILRILNFNFIFWDRISSRGWLWTPCSQGWPWISDLPVPISQVPELHVGQCACFMKAEDWKQNLVHAKQARWATLHKLHLVLCNRKMVLQIHKPLTDSARTTMLKDELNVKIL